MSEEAKQKARDDWKSEGTYNNNYELGSIESLDYQLEFSRVSNTFGEHGGMYEC